MVGMAIAVATTIALILKLQPSGSGLWWVAGVFCSVVSSVRHGQACGDGQDARTGRLHALDDWLG